MAWFYLHLYRITVSVQVSGETDSQGYVVCRRVIEDCSGGQLEGSQGGRIGQKKKLNYGTATTGAVGCLLGVIPNLLIPI